MPLSIHAASGSTREMAQETSKVVKQEDTDLMDLEKDSDDGSEGSEEESDEDDVVAKMVDPRLVFLWDKEPFRQRDSHGKKEHQMWKKAEEAVQRQSIGLGEYFFSKHHPLLRWTEC